jgi:hypothetical protein
MIAPILFLAAVLFAWGVLLFVDALTDWLWEWGAERQEQEERVLDLRRVAPLR